MKRFIYKGILFCLCAGLWGQEAVKLTVDEAVKHALANSYQLKSAQIDLAIKERADKNSWNTFLPAVNLTGTLSRSNSDFQKTIDSAKSQTEAMGGLIAALQGPPFNLPIPYTPIDYGTAAEADQWTMVAPGVSASWAFAPAMLIAIQAAHADYETGLITWQQTQAQVELNVRKLFYGILMMQQNLEIQEESLASAEERVKQAEASFRNGRQPELQYLQAQVAYENSKPTVLQARQTIENNLETFAFLIGMPSGSIIELDGAIEPSYKDLNAEDLITQNLYKSFSLQSLEANKNYLDLNKKALNWQTWFPAISIQYSYQLLRSLSDKEWYSDQVNNNLGGSLSITLAWNLSNLLPWSTQSQQAKTLEDNLKKLDVSKQMAIDNAKIDINQKVKALELAQTQIDAMEASVGLAQKAYDQTNTLYQNGLSELLDVRDAQNSLNQAKLGLLNQQYTYLTGLLDLEFALNTKL
ncbi:MAG: TolC family protein [Spirochaetaceae bacterium]|jgi:outer membrane protein TolC|nr:TolC family protein [Spirochaetaceae bacterium]